MTFSLVTAHNISSPPSLPVLLTACPMSTICHCTSRNIHTDGVQPLQEFWDHNEQILRARPPVLSGQLEVCAKCYISMLAAVRQQWDINLDEIRNVRNSGYDLSLITMMASMPSDPTSSTSLYVSTQPSRAGCAASTSVSVCCNFKNCQMMGVLVESSVLAAASRQVKRSRPPTGTDAASVGTPEIFVLSTACSKVEYGETHSREI